MPCISRAYDRFYSADVGNVHQIVEGAQILVQAGLKGLEGDVVSDAVSELEAVGDGAGGGVGGTE